MVFRTYPIMIIIACVGVLLAPTSDNVPASQQAQSGNSPKLILETNIPILSVLPDTMVAYISDFIVLDDERFILADSRLSHLVCADATGRIYWTTGRNGAGPGEFRLPSVIALVDGELAVWDAVHTRIQYFDFEGRFLRIERPVSVPPLTEFPRISSNGTMYWSTRGLNLKGLVAKVTSTSDTPEYFGLLEAPATSALFLGLSEQDARHGRIPEPFKNFVFVVPGSNGTAFVAHRVLPLVKMFNSDGELIWRKEIRDKSLDRILEEVFVQVVESGKSLMPNFWRGGTVDKDNNCYLILNSAERLIIFRIGPNSESPIRIDGPSGSYSRPFWFEGCLWIFEEGSYSISRFRIVE